MEVFNDMPNRDSTGPRGAGPLTGRGMGPCSCGMRRGLGRGYGFQNRVVVTKDEEKKMLESELKELELDKQEIQKRLKEL